MLATERKESAGTVDLCTAALHVVATVPACKAARDPIGTTVYEARSV